MKTESVVAAVRVKCIAPPDNQDLGGVGFSASQHMIFDLTKAPDR